MADNESQGKQTEKDNNVHFPLEALVIPLSLQLKLEVFGLKGRSNYRK